MKDETRKLLNNVVRKIRDNSSRPAKIGRQDKTLYFTDATGKTYRDKVWVRIGTGNGSMEMVARLGAPVPVIYNLPVRVEEVRGVLTITETDGSLASTFAGYRPIGAGMHAWQHGRIGVDALSIEGLQFEPLLVVPTNPPTMTVGVNAGRYKYGGTRKTFETTTSADLSSYVPAASQTQHFIIVCLDRTNNTLAIVDGSTVSGSDVYTDYSKMVIPFTDADIDAISINDDYLPLAAVRFYYGQTAILPADIFKDLRYWGGEIGDYAAGTHTHTEADITDLSHDAVSIQGIAVSAVAPNDNQILVYDLGTNMLVFEDPAAGGSVDAADVSYTPADNTDWSGGADPGDVDNALDQLADRLTVEEAHDHDANYAPLVHTHVKADISDFSDADYADAVHTHVEADITDLEHDAVKLRGVDISAIPPTDDQILRYDAGTNALVFEDAPTAGREILTANRTYYVRTDGSDSNDGLSNSSVGAFATIQHAIDVAATLDISIYDVTIRIGAGTYVESPIVKAPVGSGTLIIEGASTSRTTILDGRIMSSTPHPVIVRNIKFVRSSANVPQAMLSADNARMRGENVEFGSGWAHHVYTERGGYIDLRDWHISGGALHCLYQFDLNGRIRSANTSLTITGTPNFSGSFANCRTGQISFYSMTVSGTATGKRYEVSLNGVIFTNNGGANYLPGNAAGTITTGGQYG